MDEYLTIITPNVNGLNVPFKTYRVPEWIRKHDPPICSLQETHLRTKHIHKLNDKGWEKNIPRKWTRKNSWSNNTYIRQNRLQNKGHKKRPRRSFHNTQRKNLSKKHKHCKHYCTQHKSTYQSILIPTRKTLEEFKKDIDTKTQIQGMLTPHCQNG